MTSETTTKKRVQCPSCDHKGKRVSPVTLRALLKEQHASGFAGGAHSCCSSDGNGDTGCQPIAGDTGWRFCDSSNCNVVYFSEEGDATFTKSQLSVSVGVKETTGERPLCYCFKHSVASIKDELAATGTSLAMNDIRAKMKDPGCRCEKENPSGSCCLGSVGKGIKIAQEELGMSDSENQAQSIAAKLSTAKPSSNKGETIAKIGTVVSAIMASACCWLPLALLAVGVSGAGIAATLETYRPLFIVVTFGFLAAAFYFTYRPKKAASEAGHGCCPPEQAAGGGANTDCCVSGRKGRFSMMAMNKIMLWGVTILAVAFLLFPHYVGAILEAGGGNAVVVTPDMNRAVLKIEGMTCQGCEAVAAKAIRSVPGVLAVEVSYENGQAVVGVDMSRDIPHDEILAALEKVSYQGRFVQALPGLDKTTGE